ncbi:UDP-N-acetylmuramoyl-tripeptide--D-alanyl-D-alanine ligase [Lacisediminihabitans changchengi]|uniref:UDP-N-acetylmuramoyl-tripeptide--D-alanyl-D-alanine ligase n=1 Tax=Lacisediminihabitans changchengi TaxID=2787634 RepID=A0A934SRM3_9MICO|nr:UDP-N-acetylmuramoyl-tripeptide--D-alanyl-D-alanine ligase [Lacisediminihabitans changchengi]MBK4347753.1 UDP-N-acetylmuramoyl-tripeptide--D-alanyl-D-alanine ligase [Lacisediminihabitans changchengi]
MMALTLAQLAAAVDGALIAPDDAALADPTHTVDGPVETDSRLVVPGALFFAMRGENTNGGLFAEAAVANGAVLVFTEERLALPVPQIVVADTLYALAALARAVVAEVRAAGTLRVVGITGSNGKTTTKNMLRAILSAQGPTVAPQGSYNNQVGAPYTMLRIDEKTRFLVVEMGASGIGDIARLIGIVVPDISVVLKVGLAHAGEFGGIEATQRAKSEIVTQLPADAVAVLNRDDERVAAMAVLTAARPVWFGLDPEADLSADDLRATSAGTSFTLLVDGLRLPVNLRILGEHHVMNALAALAVARELGVDITEAISALEGVERAERWRMEILTRADGVTVINDAYNASPDSMAAALKTLAQIIEPGQRSVAILGEMNNLGDYADDEHDRIGRLAVRLNVQQLIVVGHRARHIHNAAGLEGSWDGESVLVETADEAYDLVNSRLRAGDVVLVKSSNAAGLRFLGDRLGEVQA